MAENITEPIEGEKQFTQAEVDAIIGKRLSEERAKYPTKEEMEAFKAYKATQQTDAERMSALTSERDNAKNELARANAEVEKLKHEKFLLGKNVPADDLEYYDFKISKAVTSGKTYEQAAEEFLKDRLPAANVRVDLGGSMGGNKTHENPGAVMNDFIRGFKK